MCPFRLNNQPSLMSRNGQQDLSLSQRQLKDSEYSAIPTLHLLWRELHISLSRAVEGAGHRVRSSLPGPLTHSTSTGCSHAFLVTATSQRPTVSYTRTDSRGKALSLSTVDPMFHILCNARVVHSWFLVLEIVFNIPKCAEPFHVISCPLYSCSVSLQP